MTSLVDGLVVDHVDWPTAVLELGSLLILCFFFAVLFNGWPGGKDD